MQDQLLSPLSDAEEIAAILDVCERKFYDVRKRPDFPKPVYVLSPRHPRWFREEVIQWVKNLPRENPQPEPTRLAQARARKRADRTRGAA